MRLYFNKLTRGTRPRWLIEEAGLPVEIVVVDVMAGEQRTDAYRRLNPNGKVPVLLDGDRAIFESAAITLHLADKAPGLAPPVGTVERGLYYQWAFWAAVTLEVGVSEVFAERMKPEDQRDAAKVAEGTRKYHACLEILSQALEGRQWLVADTFSAADILVISVLAWAGAMKMNEGFPTIEAYAARGKARPAFQRARS